MLWNEGGYGVTPFGGVEPNTWNAGGFGEGGFNGTGLYLPRYLNTVAASIILESLETKLATNRILGSNPVNIQIHSSYPTSLLVNRYVTLKGANLIAAFKEAQLNTKRLPLILSSNPALLSITGKNTRIMMEMEMIINSILTEQDKKDIAAAVIAATQINPVKAESINQSGLTVAEIANAVANNPKILTVAKFVGLK